MKRGAPGRQVNVHLAPFWVARLESLRGALADDEGVPAPQVAVIRRGLGLLALAVAARAQGNRLVVLEEDGTTHDVPW